MKIRSLQLKNIGVFEDETIHFPEKKGEGAEIHILTGQNGTGKTTILQALANGVARKEPFRIDSIRFVSEKTPCLFCKKMIHENCEGKHGRIVFDNGEIEEFEDTSIKIISVIKVTKPELEPFIKEQQDQVRKNTLELFANSYTHNYCAFSYSGYRFIDHEENLNIQENKGFNPLDKALDFQKSDDKSDYKLNQWLANTISKRNNAFFEGNQVEVEKFTKSIELLKQIIFEIIETPIDFKFKNEKAKIVAVKNGEELDFDLLPDGLRSIISWLGDLIMRMDALKWENDLDIRDREFILFLDEIEVHLHPSWQRKILPVVQKTFKNAQIFITTHSPFIVNSVDGAYIYELDLDKNGNSKVTKVRESSTADSYQTVIREIFETKPYSQTLVNELKEFTDLRNDILLHKKVDEQSFLEKATQLANKNDEVKNTILFELRQLSHKTGKEFAI